MSGRAAAGEELAPEPTLEAMLADLRRRVHVELRISEELASAIVSEWQAEAMRRGLIWWEEAYWWEAGVWIEQWFPPGLSSAATFTPQSDPIPEAGTAPRLRGPRARPPSS
jgi:hypothetical protein